jgi:hypothetical protein
MILIGKYDRDALLKKYHTVDKIKTSTNQGEINKETLLHILSVRIDLCEIIKAIEKIEEHTKCNLCHKEMYSEAD